MGKGSGTNQFNVVKQTTNYSYGASVVGGGGGGYSQESIQSCLFQLNINLKNIDISSIKLGDNVTLVMSGEDGVDIFVNNAWFDTYTGRYKKRLLTCMSDGYVYVGKVTAVGAGAVSMTIKGMGAV